MDKLPLEMYRNTINSRGNEKRRGREMKRNLIRSEQTLNAAQRERPEIIYIGKNYTERWKRILLTGRKGKKKKKKKQARF